MDAAALTKALVEIAARGETESTALADALGGFLVRVLTGAQILREGPARTLACIVAQSFLAGESLDMVILRATASADTLSLVEAGTRRVQRAITSALTSADVLTPLVARGEGDSALSEAALRVGGEDRGALRSGPDAAPVVCSVRRVAAPARDRGPRRPIRPAPASTR